MQGSKLYVGNLDYAVTEEQLKELFGNYGEVTHVNIIDGRGFGFVEMPSNSEADQAIKALNGNRLDGNHIKVKPADSGGKKKKKWLLEPKLA
mgnify:CR=1 FL=1